MEKISYGITGCGKHALQSHALPGKDLEQLKLTALCDLSAESMNRYSQKFAADIQKFTSRDEFLASGIGAVLIATPDECHFDDLTAATEAGLHVFVEKPLAVTNQQVADLPGLLETATAKGLVVSSCHPRRFDQPFMWLKDNLPALSDRFGQALELGFDFSYHKPTKDWKHDRGLLLDHANHEIDLASYLFGACAFEATRLTDSFDRYQMVGMRDDGLSFNFQGTRRLEAPTYPEWLKLRFESGAVEIDSHRGQARLLDHETGLEERHGIPPTNYAARGRAALENFGQAILGQADCYLTPEDLYLNTATSVILTSQKTWRYNGRDS